MQERTEWHRVTAFGRLGEICGEYLSKGRQVYIEGRIQYGSYEKDGVTHYTTDIIAREMKMLGTKSSGETYSPSEPSGSPKYNEPPRPDTEDDDIPF